MDGVVTRKSTRGVKRGLLVALLALLVCTVYCFVSITSNMSPAAITLAEAKTRAIVTEALNQAIANTVSKYERSDSMLDISQTENGVYLIVANTVALNSVTASCIELAQEAVAEVQEQGVVIPLGTMTNLPFLAGVGPEVNFKFTPVGSVESEYTSSLSTAGINQTLYKINMKINATVSLILPNEVRTLDVVAHASLAETVIVGTVPEVYTNVPQEEMLNVVPTEPTG